MAATLASPAAWCRQRPGTAKGLLFLSIEDETGVSNAVVMPDVFDRERSTILENATTWW